MDAFFSDISTCEDDLLSKMITLSNLHTYYSKGKGKNNALFMRIVKHPEVLCQAHAFATKKKHEEDSVAMLPKTRFKLLLCCAFYFSLLYDIFHCDLKTANPAADIEGEEGFSQIIVGDGAVEAKDIYMDNSDPKSNSDPNPDPNPDAKANPDPNTNTTRVFTRDEVVSIQTLVHAIDGVHVDMDTTAQALTDTFSKLDGDHKGMVSFADFCTFATQHISLPDESMSEYCKEYALVNSEIINPKEETEVVPDLSSPEAIEAFAYQQEEKLLLQQLEESRLKRG